MSNHQRRVLTVGHSNHSESFLIALLKQHAVTTVADVRSSPYSKFAPHFSKVPLRDALKAEGIKYAFLGRELGARSNDPACYIGGQVQYDRLAKTDLFHAGLGRLIKGVESENVAILCTEKDPLDCHRTLLVARSLVAKGLLVDHILDDGSIESYADSLLRLLDKTGQPPPDFFTSAEQRIDNALKDQEERIAYVDKELAAAAAEQVTS